MHGLVRGFRRRADVGCVTGLVSAASLASASEAYFDARTASWSSRMEPELYHREDQDRGPLFPYAAGTFGTGANLAVDRELLRRLGGFDLALGAGTRSRGGEDLDLFVRVLRAGAALAYEPTALVWHHHRAGDVELRAQMYGYGTGLTAYLTKQLTDPVARRDVLGVRITACGTCGGWRPEPPNDCRMRSAGPRGRRRLSFEG